MSWTQQVAFHSASEKHASHRQGCWDTLRTVNLDPAPLVHTAAHIRHVKNASGRSQRKRTGEVLIPQTNSRTLQTIVGQSVFVSIPSVTSRDSDSVTTTYWTKAGLVIWHSKNLPDKIDAASYYKHKIFNYKKITKGRRSQSQARAEPQMLVLHSSILITFADMKSDLSFTICSSPVPKMEQLKLIAKTTNMVSAILSFGINMLYTGDTEAG